MLHSFTETAPHPTPTHDSYPKTVIIDLDLPYFSDHKTHSPPEKCDLNSTCVLYAEGEYLFPNLWMSLHLLYDIFIMR